MKRKLIRNALLVGALCIVLAVPAFALSTKVQIDHWSRPCIDELAKKFETAAVFEDKDLDMPATAAEFQKLVRLVLDEIYEGAPDKMTREAAVYELTKIWAGKTGQDLDNIPVIKMIIYSDIGKIDIRYNQGVTVAYMKNIAKGRESRVFAPKALVTYGELAALVNNTAKAIAQEAEPGENPVAKGKFETRGDYEKKDGKVVFDFELMSHYSIAKQLKFGSGQKFEVTVTDDKGLEVYKYSDGKFFTMALVMKSINPGEALKWQDAWDMTNKEGEKLTVGKYSAKIDILVITEEGDEMIPESELSTVIDFSLYELTEEGVIKPGDAENIIKNTADKLMQALSAKDAAAIAEYVHPVKGVRLTPYTHVSLDRDKVFNKEEMKGFFQDRDVYLWGHYDGTGDEITLTPSGYYERFICSEDFIKAPEIGYNEVLSSGNMLENQFDVYKKPIVVEYYFPGFNPVYAGMDWKSLRLVFEEYEGSWKLAGIIHNQWTI